MKHSKKVVLAYSLARTMRARRKIVAIRQRKGAASPTLGLIRVISYLRARELKIEIYEISTAARIIKQ